MKMDNLLVCSQGLSRNHGRWLRICTGIPEKAKDLMRFGEDREIYKLLFTEQDLLYKDWDRGRK